MQLGLFDFPILCRKLRGEPCYQERSKNSRISSVEFGE